MSGRPPSSQSGPVSVPTCLSSRGVFSDSVGAVTRGCRDGPSLTGQGSGVDLDERTLNGRWSHEVSDTPLRPGGGEGGES